MVRVGAAGVRAEGAVCENFSLSLSLSLSPSLSTGLVSGALSVGGGGRCGVVASLVVWVSLVVFARCLAAFVAACIRV